jgi:co-chaperonin GroES (HSP10)
VNAVKGKLIPIKDHILITDMEFEQEVTAAGIVIPGQNGKVAGIKPRWGRVFAIGPTQKDVTVDEWILVEHGRWTRGITVDDNGVERVVRRVENTAILLVSDEKPKDVNLPQ